MPLKAERAEPPEGAGAGGGHVSPAPMLVGLYVPVTNAADVMLLAAKSSSVRVTPVTGLPPPTSDMMMAFCPPGPTSRMSMSDWKVWARPFSLTVSVATLPVNPETRMFEG